MAEAQIPAKKRRKDATTGNEANSSSSFTLWAGTFDVVLIVDKGEISHNLYRGGDISRKAREMALKRSGLPFEVRHLRVGDFLWVARERASLNRELVLDCVVERKRLDDLYASTQKKDGRLVKGLQLYN